MPEITEAVYDAAVTAYYSRRFGIRTDDTEFIGLMLDNEIHSEDFRAALAVAFAAGRESLSSAPAAPIVLPEGYEWCTTESRTKRHISRDLGEPHHHNRRSVKGRTGRTLCGQSGRDQEYAQWQLDQWRASGKKLVVANLKPCRLCPKSLPETSEVA